MHPTPALLSPSAPLTRDIAQFLSSYPSQLRTPPSQAPNYTFYSSPASAPDGIVALQNDLRGDWDELEWKHDFIQWMFPIREQGVNPRAKPLQVHEIGRMVRDPMIMERLRESYRIMLAFYGMRLVDERTGELDVTDADEKSDAGWPARFYNLEHSMHNYLRITRILKCLHELAHPHYVPSFLLFVLALQHPSPHDAYTKPRLRAAGLVRSMDGYWRHCLRDDAVREWVRSVISSVRAGEREWGMVGYREAVRRFARMGRWGDEEIQAGAGEAEIGAGAAGVIQPKSEGPSQLDTAGDAQAATSEKSLAGA